MDICEKFHQAVNHLLAISLLNCFLFCLNAAHAVIVCISVFKGNSGKILLIKNYFHFSEPRQTSAYDLNDSVN